MKYASAIFTALFLALSGCSSTVGQTRFFVIGIGWASVTPVDAYAVDTRTMGLGLEDDSGRLSAAAGLVSRTTTVAPLDAPRLRLGKDQISNALENLPEELK